MLSRFQSALSICVMLLVACVGQTRAFAQCADQGDCFVDLAGAPRSATSAYRTLHARHEPHYLRAGLEEALFLGGGMTWYWLDRQNRADWDFPGFGERLTGDILRFDNNSFPINFLAHPLSGGAYFHAARSNNLSLGASMAYAFGTSFVWEYVLEFREKVSINDLITTPVAGIAIGEFFSRFAWYVTHPVSARARGQRVGAFTLGILQTIHDRIDHTHHRGPEPADHLGYSSSVWHRFTTSIGLGLNATDSFDQAPSLNFALEGTFVAIPSYLRPGRFRRFVHDADVTRLRFTAVTSHDGQGEVDLFSETILAGYYTQRISDQGVGGSMLIGSGVGYRYRRVRFAGFEDDVSLTHLPGLSLEADALFAHAGLHVSARAGADFAGIRAWPFAEWERDHPDALTKTVLHRAGYAYAFGGSSSLDLELSLRGVRLGARGLLGRYDSQQGFDRTQEKLTTDVPTSNVVLDTEGYMRLYPIAGHGLLVELSVLMRRRISTVERYEQRGKLLRTGLSLGMEL